MKFSLKFTVIAGIFILSVAFVSHDIFSQSLKRDPFVPLLDSTGRVKPESELARPAETFLPLNISLKGIIWSKNVPLCNINNKVFHEGDKVFEGLTIEKINPNYIVLNDRGEKVEIYLRKKEKK